VDPKKVAAILD
jgi:ribonuclease HI